MKRIAISYHVLVVNSIVYRETRNKTIMEISSDGEQLTYNQTRIFVFSQETTGAGLQENDTICTINLPLVVMPSNKQPYLQH